jgi:hypothetical protein
MAVIEANLHHANRLLAAKKRSEIKRLYLISSLPCKCIYVNVYRHFLTLSLLYLFFITSSSLRGKMTGGKPVL